MPRDFVIEGPILVSAKGGAHLGSGRPLGAVSEVGICQESVTVIPHIYHRDIPTDDYGSVVGAEAMGLLATLQLGLSLVHYDKNVLSLCLAEALQGAGLAPGGFGNEGTLLGAGSLMGNNLPLGASGCHYISLQLTTKTQPWRFPACYLTHQPVFLPLGTQYTVAKVNFRVVPYRPFAMTSGSVGKPNKNVYEAISSGIVLWDHTLLSG